MEKLHPMVKLKHNEIDPAAVAVAQTAIKSDLKLLRKFSTLHKMTDFRIRDIVKCTFMPGLFEINGINFAKKVLYIHRITEKADSSVKVEPRFLEKAIIKQETVDILYGNQRR
jgi:hypothetical protein